MSARHFSKRLTSSGIRSVPLGEVIEFRNDIVHPKDKPKGVVTFVGLEHIERDTGVRIGSEQVRLEEMTGRRARFFKGDIVYGYLRPHLNKVWIAEFDGICSVDQYVFKMRSKAECHYVAHYLRSQRFLRTAPVDTTPGQLPRIRSGELASTTIPLPPLEEQKRIAAILDQADDLRRLRQRAIDRLNELGQAIFYEVFGAWDRPCSNLPLVKLGDALEFLTSGSRGWAAYYRDSGSLFLRIQNVRQDLLDLSDAAYVHAPSTAEANRTRVQAGDVLLSITADLGRTAVVPEGLGDAYINQHLSILRTKYFEPRYLSAALASPPGQRAILRRNKEGVKAGLNFDDIRSFEVPNVDRSLQRIFGERVAQADRLKRETLTAQSQASCLFASLQQRAFNNQL